MLPCAMNTIAVPMGVPSVVYPVMNQPGEPLIQGADYNYCYYEEYKKLYAASFMLSSQMKDLLKTKEELISKLSRLEKKSEEFAEDYKNSNTDDKKKRMRRPAVEIPRNYRCHVEKCQKLYGSEGSLLQHMKLKHPDMYALNDYQSRSAGDDDEKDNS